jgi:hypothetical protein
MAGPRPGVGTARSAQGSTTRSGPPAAWLLMASDLPEWEVRHDDQEAKALTEPKNASKYDVSLVNFDEPGRVPRGAWDHRRVVPAGTDPLAEEGEAQRVP